MLAQRGSGLPPGAAIVPVTILTGFLGAGKTTLLNRVLTESHGARLAVIVNEFGELGVDGALVGDDASSVIELANGCVCCATRGQLLPSLYRLLADDRQLDGILIETSGLADPFPVVEELAHSTLADHARLDGVIAVIDALNFDRNLDSAEAAYQQIVGADILLVNKTDLVAADIPGRIAKGVRTLNAHARIVDCARCDVPLEILFDAPRASSCAAQRSIEVEHDQRHGGFASAVLAVDEPLSGDRLAAWLGDLPASVFRAKGFVRLQEADGVVEVSAVGTRYVLQPAPRDAAKAVTGLVVIGRAMPIADLRQSLAACA
ncbi:MAG: GTP-binding protein [Rhizobiaceae bacterium]|nr:GTP-binding protein [Rhizobiaceae bacterium]